MNINKSVSGLVKWSKFFFVTSFLSIPIHSSASDIGNQIDAVISTGAFTYEPYANITLDQVGRHAYSLPRMRFTVPTEAINLVQFTPPSLDSSCGSLSINLGNFSFISLDEAISALRSIAAQSLTYGFGQAVQALCQPCWAGMRDLQKEIQRLNKFARNTCQLSTAFWDKLDGDEAIKSFESKMCKNVWNTLGDDAFACESDSNAFSNALGDFNDWIDDSGGDSDSVFTSGNVLYEGFKRLAGPDQEKLIPTATSRLFFNTDLSAAEVAMSFFGSSWIGIPEGETEPTQTDIIPTISNITQLLTNPSDCEGEDCLSVYKCNPAGTATYECSKPLSTAAKHSIPDEATCADGGDAKTLDAHMTCLVGGLVAKAQKGELDAAALTDVERIIISSLTLPEQSVLYTGTIAEIQTIAPIFTDSYSKFLQKSLLHAYVQSVVGATRGVLKQAERIEDFEASAILGKIEQVEEQLRLYDVERQETLAKVRQGDTWENIVKMYRESSAKRVMQLNSEAR